MSNYRLLFKLLRSELGSQDLEDIAYELCVTIDREHEIGSVFSQPGNLGRMSQDLQEYARRRGAEQELLQIIHNLRDDLDLTPYGGPPPAPPKPKPEPVVEQAGQKEAVTSKPATTSPPNSQVYLSYGWGGESEEIANQLEAAFKANQVEIVRDKTGGLDYKGGIRGFMQDIGEGRAVVAIISQKYLQSENCMYELTQIARNKDFYDRIFPIIMSDANIYRAVDRIKYITYWDGRIIELNEAILEATKGGNLANIQRFTEELSDYTEIRSMLDELTFVLKDMNTLTADRHKESNFQELITAVESKLAQ